MNREVHNEQEMLDKDELAVSRLVGGLKHVEAPANFERRVMAQIANGKPQRLGLFAIPAIAYVVPALLVVLVATFLVFKLGQSPQAQPNPVAVANSIARPQTAPSVSSTQTPEPASIAKSEPEMPQPAGVERKFAVKARSNVNSNQGGGSILETVREKKRPMPEGLDNSSPSSANRADVMIPTSIPVKDILSNLGMSVEFENGWHVKTISDNGAAQKTGIKVGDIITSLDDRDIDSSTSFNGSGSIRSVKVRRDGKLLPLMIVSH